MTGNPHSMKSPCAPAPGALRARETSAVPRGRAALKLPRGFRFHFFPQAAQKNRSIIMNQSIQESFRYFVASIYRQNLWSHIYIYIISSIIKIGGWKCQLHFCCGLRCASCSEKTDENTRRKIIKVWYMHDTYVPALTVNRDLWAFFAHWDWNWNSLHPGNLT